MKKEINTTPPAWIENPTLENKKFYTVNVPVWIGDVPVEEISGWIGNPRTELLFDEFKEENSRAPDDSEMLQIVLSQNDEKEGLKIRELAANIRNHGVKVPIVITHDKRILDGNRRYFASRLLMAEEKSDIKKKEFSKIPAFVLQQGVDSTIESAIITEYNFGNSHQVEWPYFIRSKAVATDFDEKGLTKDQIVEKYGIPWRYLDKWIKGYRLCSRFLTFHEDSIPARQFAFKNFIMFDEMARNFSLRMAQADFREQVFKILLDGYEPENHKHHKFTRSADVLRLDEIYDNHAAWQALVSGKGPQALSDALGIVEISNLGTASDPNPAMRRVVNGLQKLVKNANIQHTNEELLGEFRELSQAVPGGLSEPSAQIDQIVEWLESMTAKQMSSIGSGSLQKLEKALKLVLNMATSHSS